MPANGSNITESVGAYQDFNEIKNHYSQNGVKAAVSAAQQGMILHEAGNNKLHCAKSSTDHNEILQGEIVCSNNQVVCSNNKVVFTALI
jgi:hypothetical protein